MKLEKTEIDIVDSLLKHLYKDKKYSIEKIKEKNNIEMPDFIIKDDINTYLIELKEKRDDEKLVKTREGELKQGNMFFSKTSQGRINTISSIIEKGYNQLKNISENKIDFKLLFFSAEGYDAKSQIAQLRATIYGIKDIIDKNNKNEMAKPCFYFDFNDFYRFADTLDGVIWVNSIESKAQFCINSFSPEYEKIKNSLIYRSFEEGICDPYEEEKNNRGYIADCDYDRRNEKEILDYIDTKYKKKFIPFSFNKVTATQIIPKQ
ncbi:MAG: hypothetical protein A2539_00760 [Elusimicrobia bacterium RIFOXYD2_FULL_34_15]|nr:MAG: hypothetical protein A2539_00760 [Elusimicrobia bacterium RIFOXYD2_FULL_34_15]HAM38453.1 hypothetical protein [Elusimicrobiota bacterium]